MGSASSVASAATRAWRPAAARLPPGAGDSLTVVTYNILADKYATGGFHGYCSPQHLAWSYRRALLERELLGFQADVLCLQELERPYFEAELEPLMKRAGYEALYCSRSRRPADPPEVPEEGVALLYNTVRLERCASKAIRLADVLEPGLQGRWWQAVRQRDDWVLLALLRDRTTRRHFVAGTTHLYWDPRWPDIKAAQAHLLCRAVAAFVRQQPLLWGLGESSSAAVPDVPLVLCGDFNSLPFKRRSDQFDTVPPGGELVSGVYSILSTDAGIDASHHDHPAQRARRPGEPARQAPGLDALRLTRAPLSLQSAAVAAWGREPPVTNRTATFAGTLDYVWLSSGHWAVSAALAMPYRFDAPPPPGQAPRVRNPEDVTDLPPLPNEHAPSDHLALGFKLHLLPAAR